MPERTRDPSHRELEESSGVADDATLTRERLAALGSLVAGVAHEVNNPLTYVIGNLTEMERYLALVGELVHAYRRAESGPQDSMPPELQVLAAEEKLAERGGLGMLEELLSDAIEGAIRVREVAGQLLSLARPGSTSPRPVDLHAILDTTLRLLRPSLPSHISLVPELGAAGWIESDAGRLGQVLLNLLHNAVQACDPPALDAHRIVVRTLDRPGAVRIEIEDDGCGMSQATAKRVLDPYFSTKESSRGSGLGLSIVVKLLRELGGALDFHPGPSRGTVFAVELPVRSPSGDGAPSSRASAHD